MAWQMGLLTSMKDPNLVIIRSNLAVVIKDKFPKAKHHFLVLPLQNIPSIFKLQRKHLELLDEMELLARNAIEVLGEQEDRFKVGYHARPSMKHLHLHVISKDFHSECLKTKKHFNSFNTDFFIEPARLRRELEEDGLVAQLNDEEVKRLLGRDMECCGRTFSNVPKLKEHIHGDHGRLSGS